MLDGRNAEEGNKGWTDRGSAVGVPRGQEGERRAGRVVSYYTHWQHPDRVPCVNKWETFVTRQLPRLIDAHFNGIGGNAIEGVSMGAEAALMLATRAPVHYKAVAARSGC
ncbi:alpha/beta hydrolase-fold protein [Nocardia araoensis]|uniref:alpha/beta hydrolase-fold protein n=1 Tax=Nocardia araoensis TaxID=228600 RepID=UPI000318BFF6|nr:alpha/beta hydrolase-fold protein [Nocardia araoensis]